MDDLLSYGIWEDLGKCPYCGFDDVAVNAEGNDDYYREYFNCDECGKISADYIESPEETEFWDAWEKCHTDQ